MLLYDCLNMLIAWPSSDIGKRESRFLRLRGEWVGVGRWAGRRVIVRRRRVGGEKGARPVTIGSNIYQRFCLVNINKYKLSLTLEFYSVTRLCLSVFVCDYFLASLFHLLFPFVFVTYANYYVPCAFTQRQ